MVFSRIFSNLQLLIIIKAQIVINQQMQNKSFMATASFLA